MAALTIDPVGGALRVGETAVEAGQGAEAVKAALAAFHRGGRDHRNGYAWLAFKDLTFAGLPCALEICFHDGRACEAGWGVYLPDAKLESGWPTRETSDREVAFMRAALEPMLGCALADGFAEFAWGRLWSGYDDKAGCAMTGLRYAWEIAANA